jgi:FAD/FMN-containing dehydrogenase/Fe-S oxidoreductase
MPAESRMIPVLTERPAQNVDNLRFLEALKLSGFEGTIDKSYASRLAVATDNSVYQILPDAVVFPRNVEDVVRCARLLGVPAHRNVTVVPRGGGTGTNGQSLSPGIVVDLSRHLARILSTNAESRWVDVEPGVVLDDLNRQLKADELFFAPTLSPSNRATLGGMISTNASGKGSRIYGRTADHVLSLDVVLVGGERITIEDLSLEEARSRARRKNVEGQLYSTLLRTTESHAEAIASTWPNMPRTLTGYDLKQAYRTGVDGRCIVSLIPIVAGSEGTLGFIVGARLRTTALPKVKRTIAIKYAEFEDALAGAEILVGADPAAIETIDNRILTLARRDAIWSKVSHLLDGTDDPKAVNLIEFVGDEPQVLEQKIRALVASVHELAGQPGAATGIIVTERDEDATSLWELRKKGVGLLGALQGERRPIAFVEDTAVPPARLAAYVKEFRKLLDDAGLIYGMFGHVDVGCLHVRPALNLRDPADERELRRISDQVVALVKKHGGVFWGEHGKGFRSEYVPAFFGDDLFSALCAIKESFDPRGQLNPGKLAIVRQTGQRLVSVDAPKKGAFDRQISENSQRHFDVAIHCNGNGQCFSTDPNSVMCPSSKVRRDRVHSPKGRATVLREWLRQLSNKGFDAATALGRSPSANIDLGSALVQQLDARRNDANYDFSHEVYDALDGCLSCKACATQCPIKVDVPRMKSEFLSLYHRRYARPLRDYFVAALESILGVMSLVPRLFNFLMTLTWVKALMRRVVGIVDTPLLPVTSLKASLRSRGATILTVNQLEKLRSLASNERQEYVIIVQDAFTTFYEPHVVLAAYDVAVKLGKRPLLLPFFPNGKALAVKGFLGAFRALAQRNCTHLNHVAELGIDMIGIEPAITLTYRDEYPAILGTEAVRFKVLPVQEWLAKHTDSLARLVPGTAQPSSMTLLGHCTEKTLAPAAEQSWIKVFASVGVTLNVPSVGCCGMCGVFGHEAKHLDESRGIYAMSWQRKLATRPNDRKNHLVSGHSCRSQVHRVDGFDQRHPLVGLLDHLA